MHILRRSAQKLYTPRLTTFCNFTLKIQTSWAKKAVKSILETWNVNVILYVWFIYFWVKKIKIRNVNKNNFKCKNLQQKTNIIQTEFMINSTT